MNKKLLTMGLAALLMAGCSSDDVVVGEGDNGGASAVKGYVGLTITMPTGAGSRAVSYDDGETGEYKVNDVTLVFSEWNAGTSKHDIVQVTKLTPADWQKEGTGTDDITSLSVLPVLPVVNKNAKSVLVLVNSSEVFEVVSSTYDAATGNNKVVTPGSIKLIGAGSSYTTIEDLEAAQTPSAADKYYGTTGGWFMANASIKNALNLDSHDNHKQLVTIEPKTSKEAAMAAAADNVIYVERAVAKVSLTLGGAQIDSKPFDCTGTGFTSDKVTIDGWALDITNKSTFPLRRINTSWPDLDRFAPAPAPGTAKPQRYEWSVDNNYSDYTPATDPATDFWRAAAAEESCDKSLYCLENTFTIANMKQDGTTRAILRGQYVPNGIDQAEVNTNGIFRLGESVTFYKQADMLAKVKAAVVASGAVTEGDIQSVEVQNPKVGKADFTYNGAQNKIVVTKTGGSTVDLSGKIDAIKGMLGQLTYYEKGYCYYPVRIRHFADTPTPGIYEDGVKKWEGEPTYGTDDDKWLGRYGVVRNNSYVINVTGVKAPGSPTIPEPTENIDDEEFYYIQATVKVLSWTKRSQNVEL
ncbi:MAG: Mfa1 family fimbria major subunit [Bacteroidales bacterium]|nr:Mfa1 family fimbria major subunit [Bacteroidales bacterium]